MDVVMETGQQARLSNSEKSILSPRPEACDDVGDDILLDNFFDHSQPLDSNELETLLNTKFNSLDDAVEQSANSIIHWRPAQPETSTQQRSPSRTKMEFSGLREKHGALKPAQPDHPFTLSQLHPYGSSARTATNLHNHPYPGRISPTSPYEQHNTMPQPYAASHGQMPTHMGQGHYYPTSSPVAMPTMNDAYSGVSTQPQHSGYYSPSNASRQGTVDLMAYDNTILEEDEAGDTINGEIADPCYAQLLYRCLREAPDHTMTLKDVYKWVRQYSQKARDSAGTGWQNSVRHNLSMNAAFERVTASALQGQKKGSLWRLTNRALQEGVISTTRFRKDPKRKPERRSSPALKRQISGAKGGQATRAASAHRRAMQARALDASNLNSFEQHRRGLRQQEPVFLTPTSMPHSNRATASPQPGWMPNGLPSHLTHNTSLPASPCFVQSVETEPFAMGPPQSISNPQTPPEIHLGFTAPPKASPATAFGSPSKGFLNDFELAYHDQAMGSLFGNHDEFGPNTPSLGTEMSFTADELTPMSRLSVSVEPMRS